MNWKLFLEALSPEEYQNLLVAIMPQPQERNGLLESERKLCREEKPIEAIKSVRARTGLGLREAKDLVDVYRKQIGQITALPR